MIASGQRANGSNLGNIMFCNGLLKHDGMLSVFVSITSMMQI